MSAPPAQSPTIVCVLGPGRSGTSLTTRVLNLEGVYLGPQRKLIGGRPANPRGFWEHVRMIRINEQVLRALGGSWRDPPALEPGWEASDELSAEREQARELVEETFGGHPLWGWKDPRCSLTLPFWQRLLPSMRYVICVRNPVDVAASLDRHDGLPVGKALQLWLDYIAGALVNTAGRPRLLVPYDDFFDDWRPVADRLARFVGREPVAPGGQLEQDIVAEVDDRLRHHRTAIDEALCDPRVPPEVGGLYLSVQLLCATAPERSRADDGPEAALHAAVDAYARRLASRRRSEIGA